jgi:biopolymer transport protein ExbD
MAKHSSEQPEPNPENENSFGLDQPSPDFQSIAASANRATPARGKSQPSDSYVSQEKHLHDAEIKYKAMGWKGLDEREEEIPEEDQLFSLTKEKIPEDEMDMTPMVDVTFLLLIFFMITASFSLQKSLEQPRAATDDPAENVVEPIIEEDYVEIIIDQNNNYYVTTRVEAEKEAPSEREMRAILSDAKENSSATRLVIKAHLDAKHSRVITAWDAGVMVGMSKIEIKTTEQDY